MTHSDSSHGTSAGTSSINRQARLFTTVAILAFALLTAIAAPRASAITDDEELSQFGSQGSGAGHLGGPLPITTDPTTGHVYAVDTFNQRVAEFTPWGKFVKAFGWDVAPGAVNEQQEVRVRAAEGQFKLTLGASTTTDLVFGAPGSESEGTGSVEAALNALPSIGGAGGDVDVEAIPGTPDGKTPTIYVVTFKGSLAGANIGDLTISNGTAELKGGVPSTSFEARTRADGTPDGTGLESCTAESGCKAGTEGSGAGQFAIAAGEAGIAVDAAGSVYVREITAAGENGRVQKFDPAGRFLLMFGGEVNKTTNENRCTKAQLEGGDVCGIGVAGNGNGQFGASFAGGIVLDSNGKLLVGDVERIQRFKPEGEYEASVPVSGRTVFQLAVDRISGNFYMTGGVSGYEQDVRILDSVTGEEIGQLKGAGGGQGAVVVDVAGNVFVKDNQVLQFDASGKPLSPASCCKGPEISGRAADITGLATNGAGDLYVAYRLFGGDPFIGLYGPPPVRFEAAPRVPPTIVAQFATSVDRTSAVLGADINPHFWTDTRYYLEYGTGKCSEGGCEAVKPVPPGVLLTTKVTDDDVRGAGIFLEGLKPGTTYHYRFVAESSGGGPVQGEERTFTTYPAATPPKTDCPNQAFRAGFSAPLPDCRAFEMVSPVDKNNGDIKALRDVSGYTNDLDLSSTDGNRFTYSSYRAFANPKAAPFTIQYMASRKAGVAWQSESIALPQGPSSPLNALENPYKTFSDDLCTGWLMMTAEPVPDPKAPEARNNFYRREGCGGESYEALIQVDTPSGVGEPVLQGVSADGGEAIFTAGKLTDDAASDLFQTYYASEGELSLVCIGLDGQPSGSHCSGGSNEGGFNTPQRERLSSLTHAISADGSKVYWTDTESSGVPSFPNQGKVYLRLNPGEEQSEISGGECTEPQKACTLEVSGTASSKNARFLGASADGSKALFEVVEGAQDRSLYKFDLEANDSTLLAAKGRGIAGASEDLSHIYFVSDEVLPETSGATAGKPNLYLDQEGTKTFIATLSGEEVGVGEALSNTTPQPAFHAARATADGSHLAFISTESLSGYDNTDQVTGEADAEVYLYEVGAAAPICISCNPSGARPWGRMVKWQGRTTHSIAAVLPTPLFALEAPRVLSANGDRLFFNSYDALLPRDTNGKGDVYQWQAASNAKACEEKGAELYVASSGGCLSLISTGQSPSDSEFRDASANGSDVFFTTDASILPQDPGLIDIYDARVNGGLPAPPEPPGPCQGDACQNATSPPNDPTPASASFKGAGNLKTTKPRPRCGKGKARRKGRCVATKRKRARKAAQRKRDANHNRGASR